MCVTSHSLFPSFPSKVQTRYFARRPRLTSFFPERHSARSGTGDRSFGARTTAPVTTFPTTAGARPRRVTSTSGSSGMAAVFLLTFDPSQILMRRPAPARGQAAGLFIFERTFRRRASSRRFFSDIRRPSVQGSSPDRFPKPGGFPEGSGRAPRAERRRPISRRSSFQSCGR